MYPTFRPFKVHNYDSICYHVDETALTISFPVPDPPEHDPFKRLFLLIPQPPTNKSKNLENELSCTVIYLFISLFDMYSYLPF